MSCSPSLIEPAGNGVMRHGTVSEATNDFARSQCSEVKAKRHVSEEKLLFISLLAYGGSPALSRFLLAPLERLKVIRQVQKDFRTEPHFLQPQATATQTLIGVLKFQGARSFWWGFSTHMWNVVISTAIRLTAFQQLRLFLSPDLVSNEGLLGKRSWANGHVDKISSFGETAEVPSDQLSRSYEGGTASSGMSCQLNSPQPNQALTFRAFLLRVGSFSLASIGALCVTYPMDVAYTRMCADGGKPWNSRLRTYESGVRCLWRNTLVHGITSNYRGFSLCLLTTVPFLTVSVVCHDILDRLAEKCLTCNKSQEERESFSVLEPPSEKVRLALTGGFRTPSKREPLVPSSTASDLSTDGALSISTSYPPSDGAISQASIQPFFSVPRKLVTGLVSGVIAQTVTYPLDTIRRRYQYDGSNPWTSPPYARRYSNLRQCIRESIKGDGRGLLRGCGFNLAKVVPECAVVAGIFLLVQQYTSS